jgi:hypothetical protein
VVKGEAHETFVAPDPYRAQPDPYGSQPDPNSSPEPERQPQPQAEGQDWRPGEDKYGVSTKTGFDPAFHHKALGDEWAPGVHDPDGSFSAKERAIADRLEEAGWRVDARLADHSKEFMKNPECMVRKDGAHEGTITEYKTLESGNRNTVRRIINEAADQVPADGEVVVDGRNVGLTKEIADRAFGGAAGQPGKTIPAKVHIILADGQLITYERKK